MKHLPEIQSPKDLKSLSLPELEALAQEIRETIWNQVSNSGGHLAPNLGVVELTLALHVVFDFDYDRLLFDVGHQCYPHKLLTGRLDKFSKLRKRDGMAGFPEPRESDYDLFSVGHAGTSISTAMGMAMGDLRRGEGDRRAVALVGDSSIVNGVSLEGLNAAGMLQRQFLIVLNDNGMSIGQPQGFVSTQFDRMRHSHAYNEFKAKSREFLENVPGHRALEGLFHTSTELVKKVMGKDHLFEHFGIKCIGPVDGHDLEQLIKFFKLVKDREEPILLHVKTVKGKGYDLAEGDATTFHSPPAFEVVDSKVKKKSSGRSFTAAFADAMIQTMSEHPDMVTVTAGMPDGTGLSQVSAQHPDRVIDVGISESHGTDLCAGMAKSGLKPFFAVYSTFLQRGFDQTFQEVALQGLPVRFCLDRAGLVGGDGAVHHGFMDIGYLRMLPGMVLMAPIDEPSLERALDFMVGYDDAASAMRYPRDSVSDLFADQPCPPFERGVSRTLFDPAERPDAVILAYGVPAIDAFRVAKELASDGTHVRVVDARFAKPVDRQMLQEAHELDVPILTVEDHHVMSGFGSVVLETMNEMRLSTQKVYRLGLPDRWIYQGGRGEQLAEAGIDAKGIRDALTSILDGQALPSLVATAS